MMKKLDKKRLDYILEVIDSKLEPFSLLTEVMGDESLSHIVLMNPVHMKPGYCWKDGGEKLECLYAFFHINGRATIESECPIYKNLTVDGLTTTSPYTGTPMEVITILLAFIEAVIPPSKKRNQVILEINAEISKSRKTKHYIYSDFIILSRE